MKTILYIHAGAEMYGADKILLELVTGLDKKEYRPIVVLPNNGVLKKRFLQNNIETYVIPYPILRRKYMNVRGIISYLKNYRSESDEIVRLLKNKKIKVDIIHANTMAVLEGIYLKKKLNAKLVWHIHEIILSPKIVAKTLSYLVGKYADTIVAVSNAVKANLIASKVVPSEKIKVIYNGIDDKKFSPEIDYTYLFGEWNIPKDSIRVGVIGRVNKWKGQNDFLDAAGPLLVKYPKLYLFIVGSAFKGQEWRITNLKNKIKKMDQNKRIIYSSFRNDNNVVENFLNILVLPSTSPDPLPTVVLEAMGCGKAIVGYNHGGVTEMVKNGYNGVLAMPNSVNDLRAKIDYCLSNGNYKAMGECSRKRLLRSFSIDNFIQKFEKIYK